MENRDRMIQAYIEHVLEHGAPPASVFKFARDLALPEKEFYEHFASFESLEGQVWKQFAVDVIQAISQSEEWSTFNARQKSLTFLFAFFERAQENRSFFLARFPCPRQRAAQRSSVSALRRHYEEFIRETLSSGAENGEIPERGVISRGYPVAFTELFFSAIDFNLKDESTRFERTDAYLEKTTQLAFDLVGSSAIDAAVDLLRFLTQRQP